MLFKFTYTDFNITNNNHVYQVKMIFDDREIISLFKEGFVPAEFEQDQELSKQAKDVADQCNPDPKNKLSNGMEGHLKPCLVTLMI